MSIDSILSDINRCQRELASLAKEQARYSQDRAQAMGRAADAQKAAFSSSSSSTQQSKLRDAQRYNDDRAHDSDTIRALLALAGKEAVIPPRSNRRQPADYDEEKYKGRNKVERPFNRLRGYWGVATRYDKLAAMFVGGKDLRASSIDRLAAVFGLTTTQFLAADLPDTKVRRTVSSAPHKPRKAARKPKPL